MLRLLLVSHDDNSLSDTVKIFGKHEDVAISGAKSGGKALEMLSHQAVDLVVAWEHLRDMTGFEFAEKLVTINPMINCALVSSMAADDFHEASEGLGVLAQLPVQSGEEQVEELLQHLRKILNVTT
ncbi:MAG: hypothetical protein GY866_25705 [Proteobacteria bacterium]|nr:hypothetical protein [Pseudomonadota bacterium]